MKPKTRCSWCNSEAIYIDYHDTEWGVPLREDQALFELLCLEGQQAGLSWITVLRKRAHYRKVFAGFDPAKLARFSDAQLEKLLLDEGLIRNRLKIFAIRKNARAFLEHFSAPGSFTQFIWSFGDAKPRQRTRRPAIPVVTTDASDALSKALKKKGFGFVGSTSCYAFMQAAGLVNDHSPDCWKYGR